MRFKTVIVLFVILFLLLTIQGSSYAIEEWNLVSDVSYDGLVASSSATVFKATSISVTNPLPTAVGDFNGDNIDDLAIGAPGTGAGGVVYILAGGSGGFSSTPTLTITGNEDSLFGFSIANAGDIDGDSIDELIVGAPSDNEDGGCAYVLLGTLLKAQMSSDKAISLPDGDFVSLKIIGVESSSLGGTVASAGDMNANGRPEVLITEAKTGKANLFLGEYIRLKARETNLIDLTGSDFANYVFQGTADSGFGFRLGSAGDINNDGYGDIIITDPQAEPDRKTGDAYIYLGGATINTQIDMLISGIGYLDSSSQTPSYVETLFGYTIAADFDIDGDGYKDILIGAPNSGAASSGAAYLFLGSDLTSQMSVRSSYSYSLGYNLTFFGEAKGDNFSVAMGKLDADNDGYDDIVIGAPNAKDSGTGRVYYARGKKQEDLRNSFDTIMVGSYVPEGDAMKGEGLGFTIATGENMAGANKGDLYIFTTSVSSKIEHCAIINTPANVLGGKISAALNNNHLIAANSPYIVRDDIDIPAGETLTIDAGVTVKFNTIKFSAGGYAEDLLEMNVRGALNAVGTANLGHGNENIKFTVNTTSPSKGSWLGINIDDSGIAVIKNCNVGYGINGIWVDRAALTLENSTVHDNGGEFKPPADCDESVNCSPAQGNGVYIKSGDISSFKNNSVSYNESNGLLVESPDDAEKDPSNVLDEITGNEILGNGACGISNGDADLMVSLISNNTVSFNGDSGITGFIKSVITENIIYFNIGNGITDVSNCIISNNSVELNDTGIDASENSEVKENIIVHNVVGASIDSSSFLNNYVGVRENGEEAPNFYGIVATSSVDISQNYISYNYFDGIQLDSNPAKEESPAIIWQNHISYNGGNGIWLADASPKIVGNNIIYNGSAGLDKQANGIKSDNLSRPQINKNNVYGNADMALRLYHYAPTNPDEFFTLHPDRNWWGTTVLNEVYDVIWDSRDDDISILGEVVIDPAIMAQSSIDITTVSKPAAGVTPASSILQCFVATASYDKPQISKNKDEKGILNSLFEVIDNAIFGR